VWTSFWKNLFALLYRYIFMSEDPYVSAAELAEALHSIRSLTEHLARRFWLEERENIVRGLLPYCGSRPPWQVDFLYSEYRTRREARRTRANRERATIDDLVFGSYSHDRRRFRIQCMAPYEKYNRKRKRTDLKYRSHPSPTPSSNSTSGAYRHLGILGRRHRQRLKTSSQLGHLVFKYIQLHNSSLELDHYLKQSIQSIPRW